MHLPIHIFARLSYLQDNRKLALLAFCPLACRLHDTLSASSLFFYRASWLVLLKFRLGHWENGHSGLESLETRSSPLMALQSNIHFNTLFAQLRKRRLFHSTPRYFIHVKGALIEIRVWKICSHGCTPLEWHLHNFKEESISVKIFVRKLNVFNIRDTVAHLGITAPMANIFFAPLMMTMFDVKSRVFTKGDRPFHSTLPLRYLNRAHRAARFRAATGPGSYKANGLQTEPHTGLRFW